ncbi:aminotransferase class V-fold PLP-dependent enzyme [Elstera cyanobacteriorum]|uniref:aminotransferase class V-fold PLP-dependent enzyme n=1 Tax=Elstera cyanobacteriorum TaxID=2022747 RepID=UPI002355A0A7|nr:SufS family cysteine desulfurase [Elstera cyanobacteriorum]MCK6443803.1 SufS family cysteine desulfurase [Elstera cyanobacteriorum]
MSLTLSNRPHPKADFPIFDPAGPNAGIAYLDSGASAQKPKSVIEAVSSFYATGYANIHRGVYKLSANATDAYEGVRAQVARFINAASDREIIFVRGATEGLNLIAATWGRAHLKAGDAVLISALEHHANIIPWQILRDQMGVELRIAGLAADGGIDRADFTAKLADGKVKLASFTHIANATGAVLPVADLIAEAKAAGAIVSVDGCQAVPHRPVDVQALGCDFYTFSGHKIYGPTGIGILYGRLPVLETMPPYQTGGDMVATVRFEATEFLDPPQRFEAGTPDIAGVIGLGAAIDYIQSLGWAWIEAHEKSLLAHGTAVLSKIPGLTLLPAGSERSGIFSFTVEGVHPHDLGTILDHHNVAIRAGSHCAQPLLNEFGLTATARASLGLYNETEDLDRLAEAVMAAQRMFAPKQRA